MITENQENIPHISISTQYIKDLSFENPSAPNSLNLNIRPQIELSLDLNISRLTENNFFEVELNIEAKAQNENQTLFIIELKYAGVFNLINIPIDQQQQILATYCPAMIFPFARKIISDTTQDGGFQPLMIDPVDFNMLYYKKISEGKN